MSKYHRALLLAAFLFLIDIFLLNYVIAVCATIVVLIVFSVSVVRLVMQIARTKGGGAEKQLFIRLGIYMVMILMIIIVNHYDNKVAEANAVVIIEGCEEYKQLNGKYPSELEDLVPEFLEKIPKPGYIGIGSKYNYSSSDRHILFYNVFPPFGNRIYVLEFGEWRFQG